MDLEKNQIEEWAENPVTIELCKLAKEEFEKIQNKPVTDCLFVGEPVKTHENIVELEARERVWSDWIAFLEGDWDYFSEDDDDRDLPNRE